MPARLLTLFLIAAALLGVAACGGDDDAQSGDVRTRAGEVLNERTDALLVTLTALENRGKAAQKRDDKAFDKADAELRKQLAVVAAFADEGRKEMADWEDTDVARAVIADGDAWAKWTEPLLAEKFGKAESKQFAERGSAAVAAHVKAYQAAGKQIPEEFKQRANVQ